MTGGALNIGTSAARTLLSAAPLLVLVACARAELTLVADGKSDYVIVLARDASPSEKFAAGDTTVPLCANA